MPASRPRHTHTSALVALVRQLHWPRRRRCERAHSTSSSCSPFYSSSLSLSLPLYFPLSLSPSSSLSSIARPSASLLASRFARGQHQLAPSGGGRHWLQWGAPNNNNTSPPPPPRLFADLISRFEATATTRRACHTRSSQSLGQTSFRSRRIQKNCLH